MKGVTLSVGGRELLDHAHLHIRPGVHYVFIGRNGTGKSTLLKALAEHRIPGVPSNLRILLLGQTRMSFEDELESLGHLSLAEGQETVLQHVVRSDAKRERLLREAAGT